jgi:hypothetical protein
LVEINNALYTSVLSMLAIVFVPLALTRSEGLLSSHALNIIHENGQRIFAFAEIRVVSSVASCGNKTPAMPLTAYARGTDL